MKYFFIVFLLVYVLASAYVFVRGWQLLPNNLPLRIVYCLVFVFLWSAYIVAMLAKESWPVPVIKWLCIPGGIWFAVMIYLLMALLAIDLLRIANYFFHFFPAFITGNVYRARLFTGGFVLFALSVIFIIGHYRFSHPVVEELELDVDKPVQGRKELNIVAISDVHLGFTIGKDNLKKYVAQINALEPDIILIAGDLIDISTRPLETYRMYEELQQLKAPLGVYMVTGNHEYIAGIDASVAFIEKTGIRLLRNEFVLLDSTFVVAGEEDISGHENRRLKDILQETGNNDSLPVIALCHQPQDVLVKEAADAGVDLLLCGHTHQGQFWPGNQLVKKMFKYAYGYGRMDNMHVYVSSGLGIWGPQFRIGTQSEIVKIKLKFKS